MARVKTTETQTLKVSVPSDTDSSGSDAESQSSAGDATSIWEAYEDEALDMVETLREHLSTLHPGIGDRMTLAKFSHFIVQSSSCL